MLKLGSMTATALLVLSWVTPARPADDRPVGEGAVEAVVIGKVVKPGSGADKVAVPFLLLKDGRAYQEEAASPLDFRPSSRPFGSWGVFTWTRTADGYQLTAANGGIEDLAGQRGGAPDGGALSGTYVSSGDNDGRKWSETVTFRPDGSYGLEQSQSVQGAGMMGGGGWQSTGTYRITGWTITTEGFGSPLRRKLFARSANGDWIVVGAMAYGASTGSGRGKF